MSRVKEQSPRGRISPPFEKPTTIAEAERVLDHLFDIAHQEADQGRPTFLRALNTPEYLMVAVNTLVEDCDGLDEYTLMDAFERRLNHLTPEAMKKLRLQGFFRSR